MKTEEKDSNVLICLELTDAHVRMVSNRPSLFQPVSYHLISYVKIKASLLNVSWSNFADDFSLFSLIFPVKRI